MDDAEPIGAPTDSQGTLLFDVKWGCDESDIVATGGLITSQNSTASLGRFTVAAYYALDNTNDSSINSPAFSAGDIITYSTRWGDVDGNANNLSVGLREAGSAWSFDATPGNYDGEFPIGTDLRLSFGNLYPIHISNIQFWDEPIWFKHRILIIR